MTEPIPTSVEHLDWVSVCDDCLDGIHHRCRLRRKCACADCKWQTRKPKPKTPKPVRNYAFVNGRPGRPSENATYNAVDEDVCLAAVELYKKSWSWQKVADELGVERTNLYRAMKRRGLR